MIRLLSIFFSGMICLGLIFSRPSFAASSQEEISTLKQEILELKQAVKDLKEIVQLQNEKIKKLEKTDVKENPKFAEETKKTKPLKNTQIQIAEDLNKSPKLESKVEPFNASNHPPKKDAARLLPNISVVGSFTGSYFKNEPGTDHDENFEETSEHEEEHTHAETGHDPTRTGLNLQEVEVAIQAAIDPYLRGDVFLNFNEEGVEIEEAYVTTLGFGLPKGLQIRAGKYLQPFGRQNQKHLEARSFINDHLINQKIFGGEGFNELGIELSYLFPTPFFLEGRFSFSEGSNLKNFDGERKQDFAYTGRFSTSFDLSQDLTVLAGASGAFGFNKTGEGQSTKILGADLLLKWRPTKGRGIDWQTEYLYRRKNVLHFEKEEPIASLETEGGISSYIIGQWSPHFGAGLRAEYFGIPKENEQGYRLSPMLFYKPSEFFRLRLQYDYTNFKNEEPNHAAHLQMIFNLGSHGAHAF